MNNNDASELSEYVVKNSEYTRKKCSDCETKALLYLMNCRNDSNEISYYAVDFFNDVTGINNENDIIWDVQAKGSKLGPAKIGRSLVTLFKNYLSDFPFKFFILFMDGVSPVIEEELSGKMEFDYSCLGESIKKNIQSCLKNEAEKSESIINEKITDDNLSVFLDKVLFVTAEENGSHYVKKMIKVSPDLMPDELDLKKIFVFLRNFQSTLKIDSVEGMRLNHVSEVSYCKSHIVADATIRMFILERVLDVNIRDLNTIPKYFTTEYNKVPEEKQDEFLEECKGGIYRVWFDVNNFENFWRLFEDLYVIISKNSKSNVDELYELVDKKLLSKVKLGTDSTKYFIALMKVWTNDN